MQSKTISLGLYQTNCSIISGSFENESFVMVIDPGDHFSYIKENLPSAVTHIVITHYHFDHIGALKELKESFPKAKIYCGAKEITSDERVLNIARNALGPWFPRTIFAKPDFHVIQPDIRLKEHDMLLGFEVLETPGHTEGSISLYNKKEKMIFTGDTVFKGTIGRTDFEGGSFDDILFSVKKIMALDADTAIIPGHGENSFIVNERQYYV